MNVQSIDFFTDSKNKKYLYFKFSKNDDYVFRISGATQGNRFLIEYPGKNTKIARMYKGIWNSSYDFFVWWASKNPVKSTK